MKYWKNTLADSADTANSMKKGVRARAVPEKITHAWHKASDGVDLALKKILVRRAKGLAKPAYQMLQYFHGFLESDFSVAKAGATGKRFRPALCLYLADAYGARRAAFSAALAIEMFHNFTLIHDDVEDRDEMRRNRPTVWKLWGVNHAINTGDLLSLIVSDLCVEAGPKVGTALLEAFKEVLEGQYLDFELADMPLSDTRVNETLALLVDEKKTGALIAAACESAGIAAGKSVTERKYLRAYGYAVGMVFQLADDYRSIWETKAETGKDTNSDIREHKRTLPFFAARKILEGKEKQRLEELYGLTRQLTEPEINEALTLINSTEAKKYTLNTVRKFADRAQKSASKLSVSASHKSILIDLVDMLVPTA